jgi:hypothetical protein
MPVALGPRLFFSATATPLDVHQMIITLIGACVGIEVPVVGMVDTSIAFVNMVVHMAVAFGVMHCDLELANRYLFASGSSVWLSVFKGLSLTNSSYNRFVICHVGLMMNI